MKYVYLLLLVLLLIGFNSAQWVSDPALNNPICVFSENQDEVALCSDNAGGVFMFWRDHRDETSVFLGDIYGQHVDSSGMIKWSENGSLVQGTIYGEFRPYAVPDGKGGVILVWAQTPGSFYNYKLFCQRIDSTGNKLWDADGITIAGSNGTNSFHQIAPDDRGGAYIVWQNLPGTPGTTDIYVQHVDSSGAIYWPANGLLLCGAPQSQSNAVLCPDGTGGVFIAWEDNRDTTDMDVYGQYIDSSKTVLWGENGIALCQDSTFIEFPVIVSDGQTGVFVAWTDHRNDGGDIALQHVTSGGELLLGAQGKLICSMSETQSNVQIVSNGDQGAYIIWQDGRLENYDIYAQYIDQDDSSQWTANGIVICDAAENQLSPDVHIDEQGNCFITWQDNRNDEWGDIYAQMVNADGQLLWTEEGVALATASGLEQVEPVVELISDGNLVTSWRDRRNSDNYDIYLQKANRDENIVSTTIENREGSISMTYELLQNYPNPFNSSTVIHYQLYRKSNIELVIYNILGEKIATLEKGFQDAGPHQINWNANHLPSGIYFCCLRINKEMKIKRMLYLK